MRSRIQSENEHRDLYISYRLVSGTLVTSFSSSRCEITYNKLFFLSWDVTHCSKLWLCRLNFKQFSLISFVLSTAACVILMQIFICVFLDYGKNAVEVELT